MMFWKSSTTTSTTTTTTSTSASSSRTSNGTAARTNGSAATPQAATTIPSYVLSEQRRTELLLAARANRVSWIDGVDEASAVGSATSSQHYHSSNSTKGASIPPQCQEALEAIATDMRALLASLEELKRAIVSPSAQLLHDPALPLSSADSSEPPVAYRTIFQDLTEHEDRLAAWLDVHRDDFASPTCRARWSIDDKEIVFLLAFRELIQVLKSPRAADVVYQIQTFVSAFTTQWDLSQMLEQRALSDRPGGRVHAFIAKLVQQLQHNDRIVECVDLTTKSTDLLISSDAAASAEWLHDVLEAFVMEKVYATALTPTPKAAAEDHALHDRMAALAFVDFTHLDLRPPVTDLEKQQWIDLAMQLQQLPLYLSPRRKIDCILRVCQSLTSLLTAQDAKFPSADEFLPALIYLLVQANPIALKRNVAFILEYRKPSHLVSEPGYFFTHLVSSVAFVEDVDASQLTISRDAFEKGLQRQKLQVGSDLTQANKTTDAIGVSESNRKEDEKEEMPSVLAVRAKRMATMLE